MDKNRKSIRKLLCFIIVVAMIVTLMPMTVFAADPRVPITTVEVYTQTPIANQPCFTDSIDVYANSSFNADIYNAYWYNVTTGEKVNETHNFREGNTYCFHITLEPLESYKFEFDTSSTAVRSPYIGNVTVNGEDAVIAEQSYVSDNYLDIVSRNYTIKALQATKSVSVALSDYNRIKASWTKVAGADGYRVVVVEAGKTGHKIEDATTGTSITLKKLADGKKYYVKVSPYLRSDDNNWTYAPAKSSPAIYTLKKLNTPKVSRKSSGSVTVSWNNIAGESGYQISKSTTRSKIGTIYTVKTTTSKSKVFKVKRKKTYYYKVRAFKTVNGKKIYAPWSSVKAYKLR